MKFADRFPKAGPFDEVLQLIIKNIENAPCAHCRAPTPFLDYAGVGPAQWNLRYVFIRATPVCSEECLIGLVEKKTGRQLGKPDDYRQLEAPE